MASPQVDPAWGSIRLTDEAGDPPELRLVCTVCLVKASDVSDDMDRLQSAPRP